MPARFFVDTEKIILKYKWKGRGTKTVLNRKNNMGRISLVNFDCVDRWRNRSMELNTEYRNRPAPICSINS